MERAILCYQAVMAHHPYYAVEAMHRVDVLAQMRDEYDGQGLDRGWAFPYVHQWMDRGWALQTPDCVHAHRAPFGPWPPDHPLGFDWQPNWLLRLLPAPADAATG